MSLQNRRKNTAMVKDFSQAPESKWKRSVFNRSKKHLLTCDSDKLIPIMCEEILPGDSLSVNFNMFIRSTNPFVTPFLDDVYVNVYSFFIPNRLVWDNWESFIAADNDGDITTYLVPTVTAPAGTGLPAGCLYDYLGVVPNVVGIEVNNLFARAYNLCFNEWFSSEELQLNVSPLVVDKDDGPDDPTDYVCVKRGKPHDYFTACLTAPQRGSEVSIGLTGDAPVTGIGKFDTVYSGSSVPAYETDGVGTVTYANATVIDNATNRICYLEEDPANSGYPNVRADLSSVSGVGINDLREALAIQRLLEADARYGTRYPSLLIGQFGVQDPMHAVLQRPQYLGGCRTKLIVNTIAQTSESGTTEQGTLTGQITGASDEGGFNYSATEHGAILSMICIDSPLTYSQGIPRQFSRSTRYDYYFPRLANLGEQAVLNKEIYAVGTGGSSDEDIFGYIPRFDEYRYGINQVSGLMRPAAVGSLATWNLSEEFGSLPTLSAGFIEQNTTDPLERALTIEDEPHWLVDCAISNRHTRVMPVHAIPHITNRF